METIKFKELSVEELSSINGGVVADLLWLIIIEALKKQEPVIL